MEICTTDEVFDFIGAEEDIRDKKKTFIEFLIKTIKKELEALLGRKLENENFQNLKFKNNINCFFVENKIYLKYKYRDIYKITKLSINNIESSKYTLNKYTGSIVLDEYINPNDVIEITGELGLVDSNGDLLADLKLAALELIAVKSRLWTRNIYTLDGTVKTLVLDVSDETNKIIDRYKIKFF